MTTFNHTDYNIPLNDYQCYMRYQKFNWVYDLSHLRERQNLKFDYFKSDDCTTAVKQITLNNDCTILEDEYFHGEMELGYIFVPEVTGEIVYTDCIVQRGDIKWMKHHDNVDFTDEVNGEVELRALAMVALYFNKFNGVLSLQNYGSDIFKIALHPSPMMIGKYDEDAIKLLKKIYKKN